MNGLNLCSNVRNKYYSGNTNTTCFHIYHEFNIPSRISIEMEKKKRKTREGKRNACFMKYHNATTVVNISITAKSHEAKKRDSVFLYFRLNVVLLFSCTLQAKSGIFEPIKMSGREDEDFV